MTQGSDSLALWREADIIGNKDSPGSGVYRVSRSYFRREVREGAFPKPIKRGRMSFWRKADVLAHLRRIAGDA
jgi:hypothetical protein